MGQNTYLESMTKVFLFLFFLFLANILIAQSYYQVTTETLNVRSAASKEADIVSKFYLGDSVYVLEYSKSWSEVKVNDTTTGFVASKYLSKDFNATTKSKSQSYSSSRTPIDFSPFIYCAIIAIILYIVYRRYKGKCKACGRWYAMKISDEEVVDRVNASVKKTTKERNSKGEVIRTNEVYIPATKTKYLITETCKHCGHEEKYYTTETKEN